MPNAPEPKLIEVSSLALSPTAALYEGENYGGTVSIFITDHPRGKGPDLHRHPYDETFVVRKGRARFTAGEETIEAEPGQIVFVPANTWHGFKGASDENLEMVCIHPNERVVQEELEADSS
jgi:quercetin dioxygenase-like cupin family protein